MTDRPTFKPGVKVPDLEMPVYYPRRAMTSRRARARFRKQHGMMVRRVWKGIRKDIQRDGGIPGAFTVTYLEPMTYTITTMPVAEATDVDWG